MKTVSEYLALPYRVNLIPEDGGWVAVVPDLPGCMTQADDWDELQTMIQDAKRVWIAGALKHDMAVPEPSEDDDEREYSGRTQLRMPKTMHRDLVEQADLEGVSLNAVITNLLAGGVGWQARTNDDQLIDLGDGNFVTLKAVKTLLSSNDEYQMTSTK